MWRMQDCWRRTWKMREKINNKTRWSLHSNRTHWAMDDGLAWVFGSHFLHKKCQRPTHIINDAKVHAACTPIAHQFQMVFYRFTLFFVICVCAFRRTWRTGEEKKCFLIEIGTLKQRDPFGQLFFMHRLDFFPTQSMEKKSWLCSMRGRIQRQTKKKNGMQRRPSDELL